MAPDAAIAGEVTRLLHRVRDGDPAAFDRLLPLVYDSLRQVARRQLRWDGGQRTLCTTDLVHESYIKLVRQAPVAWEGQAHFYGIAGRAMRQILVDHARRRGAARRRPDAAAITLTNAGFDLRLIDVLALDAALHRLDLLNRRLRQVVECRFFGGMSEQETADVLQVSTRTIQRDWLKARMFLHRELYPDDA